MKKYLKLLLIALCASMSFTLVSCKDDDDDDAMGGSIVGTWKIDSSKLFEEMFDSKIKSIGYYRFQQDGTYIELYYYKEPGEEAEIEVDHGKWSQSGNSLTIKIDGETIKGKIISMDNSSFTLVADTEMGPSMTLIFKKCSDSEMDQYLP